MVADGGASSQLPAMRASPPSVPVVRAHLAQIADVKAYTSVAA